MREGVDRVPLERSKTGAVRTAARQITSRSLVAACCRVVEEIGLGELLKDIPVPLGRDTDTVVAQLPQSAPADEQP